MPISNRHVRRHAAGALFALSAVIIVACGAAGECLRFSDCDQGLTCAYGMCVVPPQPPSDGDTTEGDAAATTTGADTGSSTVITPSTGDSTTEAGVDAGTDATSE